ncbi:MULTISPECIES: SGNH/GDSL hydrolase family protein [Micrococcaceae]|uniref:SGNH/GDSL hydrolase family protein n=1 Tax=Micrococcaceae TaxID=1268 RepID=UPI00117A5520|nr:GDSL-type esterase/lipase family protein [Glutamicibacter sp. BW78]
MLAVIAGAAFVGGQGQPEDQSQLFSDGFPMARPMAASDAQAVTFSAVGDSITADHAYPEQVAQRIVGERSWAVFAQEPGTSFVGGWALGGATTADMLAGYSPISSDVLVLIAGTNDIRAGVPFEKIGENLQAIVSQSDSDRVLVSSVPPRDEFRARTVEYNAWLHDFVLEQGWGWIDGSRGLRDSTHPEVYAAGLSYDGTHPTAEGGRILGSAVQAALGTQPTAQDTPVDLP